MTKRVYQNSKEKIIDAATNLIVRGGLSNLTTEAVIHESGLSKAGFFYNFKTKEELIVTIIERLILGFVDSVIKIEKEDKNPVGRSLRAFVKVTIEATSRKDRKVSALWQTFVEMHIQSPELLVRLSKPYQKIMPFKKNQGISYEQELLVLLALDGLWANDGVHSVRMNARERKRIEEVLISMTEKPFIPSSEKNSRKISEKAK